MKTLKTITLSLLFLAVLTTGCENESLTQNCEGDNAEFPEVFYSEELASIPCGLQSVESDNKEVNLVITNQADLEKYFTCHEQLPEIDFNKYFILAGSYTHHQCALLDSQSVSICNGRIAYNVNLLEQDCQAITSVFYAIAIENKYNNLPVDFKIQFKN
ncbi:hypothetical protein [Reichenbachiella ulvae]|uniref:Lipoprotein n=1 Tax=Reichenbachiella ulvae TaxID=2980104 RepID=A0ABT3CWZ7_9BACT|nr:hypothetical protein [Reichenbachiella ulvae]MCV9388132.1 hypothetical protein [Reichenbachiella ulvae]